MLRLASETPEVELIAFVRNWLNLLAQGRIDDACNLLDEPNSYGETWNAHRIRTVVQETFGPGTVFGRAHPEGPVFTPVDGADPQCRCDVIAFADGRGYAVDHEVPLNGSASDLTAQFEFLRRGTVYAAILHDLHVL